MHRVVELETSLDFFDHVSLGFENVIHVMSAIELAGIVGEFLATELLDFIKLGAFFFELFGDGADEVVNAALRSLGVQDNHALVLAIHLVPFVFSVSSEFGC